jgi:carboxyl-terminal processing protease
MVKLDNFTDSSTGNNTANDLDGILSKDNSKNIIIDLRDNGGGALSSAINVVDLFLPKDKLVTTLVYKDGTRDSYYTKTDDYYDYEKIIILQNSNTASASEIFISAMLHYFPNKVSLIGTESYGKGIAQLKRSVLNGEYILQYTCARWLRPNDEWIGMTDSYYGKDHEDNYELGFDPSPSGSISKHQLLTTMQYYSSGIDFKTNEGFIAYKEDYVAYSNAYFFAIFNDMYGTNGREDYYFDSNCTNLIKQYQISKGVNNPNGKMNLDTIRKEIELVDELQKNIDEFDSISSKLKAMRSNVSWNGISQNIVVTAYKKYEGRKIIQQGGELFVVDTDCEDY